MDLQAHIQEDPPLLMEGAMGLRLEREYHLHADGPAALAELVYQEKGRKALQELWRGYLAVAERHRLPFLATTPTRRCNRERAALSGLSERVFLDHVQLLQNIREQARVPMYIGGLMGCRGDAYTGEGSLQTEPAHRFHSWQAEALAGAGVDFLFAGIMPAFDEAAGMAQAMADTRLPYIISFTIREDGCLVDGTLLNDAIKGIDQLVFPAPLCYMANCVHPQIVYRALARPENRTEEIRTRFLGIQGNTAQASYTELEHSPSLEYSPPEMWTEDMLRLRQLADFKIFGGCCGTNFIYMETLARRLEKKDTLF